MPANRTSSLVGREGLGGPYFLLTFRHPETAREARPGQFVMIKAGVSAEPPLRRPFSILETSPERETFTLFVKAIGPGSSALCSLPIGGVAQCLGPLGRPFSLPPRATEALLVGGGYGVAPFSFLGGELARGGGRARLFYGGRTGADLPLLERLRERGLDVVPATEDGSVGAAGRVTRAARGPPRRGLGPAAALRLRPRGDDARRGADRRGASARGGGQPRPVDGLRRRHLPRLRRPDPGRRTTPAGSTGAPAPRARSSTRRASSGPARTSRARDERARGGA